MGSMSKRKGARGELEAAAELSALGIASNRGRQYHGGPDSPDVVVKGARIHVEAKRVESLALYPALEQARADCPAGSVPIVWHRRNHKPSVVVVETARLVDLAREILHAVGWRTLRDHDARVARELEALTSGRDAASHGPP